MNTKIMVAAVLASACVVVGCVSVEQTRAQLNSNNAFEIQKAENTIYLVATEGHDPSGFVQFTPQEQIEYVALAPNNELLLKILGKSRRKEVALAAANRLDFAKDGLAIEILTKHRDLVVEQGLFDDVPQLKERLISSLKASDLIQHKDLIIKQRFFNDIPQVKSKLLSSLKENDLIQLLGENLDYEIKREIAQQLLAVTQDTSILSRMFDGDLSDDVGYDGRETAAKKLIANASSLSDKVVVGKLLKSGYAKSEKDRKALFSRFSEDEAVQYAMENIRRHNVYLWNNNDLLAFTDGIVVSSFAKKTESAVKIVSAILAQIASYRKACKDSWTMRWEKADDEKAANLIKGFSKFSDATISELICADETSWKYFIDSVSANVAYDVLSKGKAKSAELELALVKKLPKAKIDMAVYAGTKYDDAKKAIAAGMPPELRKQVAEAAEKAYAMIVEKAKNAAKETFELDGFYLGMSFDDMKIVFAHHFPEWQIRESIDGEGKDADYVIYVPGQTSPFCYASLSDKKVYQFNFGKKMLKKWYKYDVQNYAEWARMYSRGHKVEMKYKLVEKEATVYEPMNASRSYRVWFYQHSYQYKHNAKDYRLTYFAEEKDFTGHGGVGGALIKEQAAPRFRYVRGDPGSLRVKIERD